MFDRPENIISSGLFVCQPIISRPVEITSPFVKPLPSMNPAECISGSNAASFTAKMKSEGAFVVLQPVLSDYATKLIEVSRTVKESSYDVVLCPFRGARLAGLQADLVCQSERFRPFDGSDMGRGMNDDRILNDLRRLILDKQPSEQKRKIGVLDTAVGGDSCRELSRLLRLLNDETKKEEWKVEFHLIYASNQRPPRANQAYQFQNERMKIEINYHFVTGLLIEDEPKLLGYDVSRSSGQSRIIRLQEEGQILVSGPEKATLYNRGPLDTTLIGLVSHEIMVSIPRMPDITPASPE